MSVTVVDTNLSENRPYKFDTTADLLTYLTQNGEWLIDQKNTVYFDTQFRDSSEADGSGYGAWRLVDNSGGTYTDNAGTIRTTGATDEYAILADIPQSVFVPASMFGATYDGATDDTTAHNNAFANHSSIELLSGTSLNGELNPKSFNRIRGAGAENTKIVWNGAANGTVMKSDSAVRHGTFKDFSLNCNQVAAIGFDMAYFKECVLSGITVLDPTSTDPLIDAIGFDLRSSRTSFFAEPCFFNRVLGCKVYAGTGVSDKSTTGTGASATATLSGDTIASIAVDTGGSSYTSSLVPDVVILGDGTGATATATVTGDAVTSIAVDTAGSGYSYANVYVSHDLVSNYYCEYGFRIRENANGNHIERCASNYAYYGFAFEAGDNPNDVANQNTLITCASEPAMAAVLHNSENNAVISHRCESYVVGFLFGDATRQQYNSVFDPTFYSSSTVDSDYSNINGNNIIIDPENDYLGNQYLKRYDTSGLEVTGDVKVGGDIECEADINMNQDSTLGYINMHLSTSDQALRFGSGGSIAGVLSSLSTGCKLQGFNGSAFEELWSMYAGNGSDEPTHQRYVKPFSLARYANGSYPDISGLTSTQRKGFSIYDTTLNKVVVNNGTDWIVQGSQIEINEETGTTYTLVLADQGKYVRMNNAAAIAMTVPPNGSVAFPIGTQIILRQVGAGQVTVTEGSGVTVTPPTSYTLLLEEEGATATLIKTGTDTWDLTGQLEAV